MQYSPDTWVVLKIKAGKMDPGFYKLLAGWSGGFLDGDAWRLNSGITEVKEDGDYYEFYGTSGSMYRCYKKAYGLRMSTAGTYNYMKDNEQFPDQITLMPEETNWMELV